MPLMQGKSQKAFGKNVGTEMKHGKDQKQALAIAYAVKRKAQKKKMADGGEVIPDSSYPAPDAANAKKNVGAFGNAQFDPDSQRKVSNSMKKAFGQMAEGGMVENEDENPRNEPEHGAEDAVLEQQRYSHEKLSHGQLPKDKEASYSMMSPKLIAQMVMLKKNGEYPDGRPEEPGEHFASGGMAHYPYSAPEEMGDHFASGGMMKEDEYPYEITPEEAGDHYGEPSTMGYGKRNMFDGGEVNEYPVYMPEEEGDEYDGRSGYAEKMMMAEGGMAKGAKYPQPMMSSKGEERPDQGEPYYDKRPEDGDSIDNTNSDDHPDNDFLSDEEDTHYFDPNQANLREPDAKMRRKGMIAGIMRNLHAKHMGK